MIFCESKLIFLHVQKTGGNSISRVLLPYSDDQMSLRKHQDGVDRFGVSGKLTRRKHGWLADYKKTLGRRLADYEVAISVRNPLDRAISMYFSPHRWMVEREGEWHAETPYWDLERFENIISSMSRITDFLEVRGRLHRPDHVIRFDHMAEDMKKLTERLSIPFDPADLPHVNKSAGASNWHRHLKAEPQVRKIVQKRFASDYELLESLGI